MLKEKLIHAGYLATNLTLYAGIRPAHLTARVTWERPLDDVVDELPTRPIIFCGLHRYAYLLYLVFGRHVPPEVQLRMVGHDGPFSQMQVKAGDWIGHPVFQFRRRAKESPRQQLIAHLREQPGAIALLPDSGGPYGVVKPGIVEIARATNAWIVPFAIAPLRRTFTFGSTLRHVVPLPFSKLNVLRGETLVDDELSVERLQAELDALERRVDTIPARVF